MLRIMLICSAGMSTSLLVKRLNEAIEKRQIKANVIAVAEVDYDKYRDQVDVIFLAPQVRFISKNVQRKMGGSVPVEVIGGLDYGTMNGEKILRQAMALTGKKEYGEEV